MFTSICITSTLQYSHPCCIGHTTSRLNLARVCISDTTRTVTHIVNNTYQLLVVYDEIC